MFYKKNITILILIFMISFGYCKDGYKRKYEGYYIRDDYYALSHLLIKHIKDKIYDIKIIAFSEYRYKKEEYEFSKLSFRAELINDIFTYEEDLLPDSKFGLFLRFIDNKILITNRDKYDFLKPKITFVGRYIKSHLDESSFFDIYFQNDYIHNLDRYKIK